MRENVKYLLSLAVVAALSWLAGYMGIRRDNQDNVRVMMVRDTVVRRDTVLLTCVRPDTVRLVRVVERQLPLVEADSGAVSDSLARVRVPWSQAVYSGNGYRAWVSGFEPRLDSLELLSESTFVTMTAGVPQAACRRSRWGVGVSAGVAVTPHGVQPYVGVGVTFDLLRSRR